MAELIGLLLIIGGAGAWALERAISRLLKRRDHIKVLPLNVKNLGSQERLRRIAAQAIAMGISQKTWWTQAGEEKLENGNPRRQL